MNHTRILGLRAFLSASLLVMHLVGAVHATDGSSKNSGDAMWGYRTPSQYQILPRPTSHKNKDSQHAYDAPQAVIESSPAQPYAYGWFGTKPSPQWSRQFGTRSVYTQWTLK